MQDFVHQPYCGPIEGAVSRKELGAPMGDTSKNPLNTQSDRKKWHAKRANDLCKMLVMLPALLGAPRGPPGGGLLTPGLLLTAGRSYSLHAPIPMKK